MKAKYLFFLVSVLFGCFFYSCELDPDFVVGEVPTISNLTISSPANLSCDLPCNNTFTATSLLTSPTNTGDEVSYTWDFGDGTTEVIGNNITHEYTTAGEYDITLTASAPDATDISINPKFFVDPNGTFIKLARARETQYCQQNKLPATTVKVKPNLNKNKVYRYDQDY